MMKTRHLWASGILALVATVVFACSDDAAVDETVTGTDAGGSDRFVSADTSTSTTDAAIPPPTGDLQLLSISDWHGQVEPFSENDANGIAQEYGGLGVLKAYFAKERAKNPNTLLFTGGDAVGGTPVVSSFFDDEPAVKGLDFLGLTADTFGNHNFDRGTAAAKKLIDLATYKVVSTNLTNVATELGPKVATPYLMLEVGASSPKIKVAVLGITNPDAPKLVFPGRLGTLTVAEPIKAANDAATAARAAGAHVIVCLVHMGATGKDVAGEPAGPAVEFAKGLKGVDVVLADHTDVQFKKTIGDALVVENRSKGRTYATIALKVDKGKLVSKDAQFVDPIGLRTAFLTCEAGTGSKCPCPDTACPATYDCRTVGTAKACQKNEITADPAAATLLQPYKDALSTKLDVKIGTAADLFPRGNFPTPADPAIERVAETPVGDLVADALLDAYKTSDGAQIAFTNGGGLRDSIPAKSGYTPKDLTLVRPPAGAPWDVTVGDARAVLIFNNSAVVRKITGKLLWQVLDFSVGALPAANGRFLQIAGFSFTFDRTKTPRVQSVTLDGGTVVASDSLTDIVAVTNDFTSAGGDDYAMLKETIPSAARDVMVDLLIALIKKKVTLDPAEYPAARRIVDVTP